MIKVKKFILLFVIAFNLLQNVLGKWGSEENANADYLTTLSEKRKLQLEKHFLQMLEMSKIPDSRQLETTPEYMKLLYQEQETNNRDNKNTDESLAVVAVRASNFTKDPRHMTLKFERFPAYISDIQRAQLVIKTFHETPRTRKHHGRKMWQITMRLCSPDLICTKYSDILQARTFQGQNRVFETFDITGLVKSAPRASGLVEFELKPLGTTTPDVPVVQNEALLVVDKNTHTPAPQEQGVNRRRRSARNRPSELQRTAASQQKSFDAGSNRFKREETPCSHHVWFLNFTHLGWNSWIISPNGYYANYCSGFCIPPMDKTNDHNVNMTNHAFVSTLYHSHMAGTSAIVSKACCVPVHMSPISILFRNDKNETVLREMKEMQADYCGCL